MRNMRRDAIAENVQQGASEEEIGTIPTVKVAEGDVEGDCAICLEPYAAGDELRKLPCDHTFHKPCLDNWLKINGTCPYCRGPITKGEKKLTPRSPNAIVPLDAERNLPAEGVNQGDQRQANSAGIQSP